MTHGYDIPMTEKDKEELTAEMHKLRPDLDLATIKKAVENPASEEMFEIQTMTLSRTFTKAMLKFLKITSTKKHLPGHDDLSAIVGIYELATDLMDHPCYGNSNDRTTELSERVDSIRSKSKILVTELALKMFSPNFYDSPKGKTSWS